VNGDIDKKLEELQREVREGHASLHVRHDNHDQAIDHAHSKLDTLKRMLVAVFQADAKAFMDAWHGR
jgi:hypothetical protein